MILKQISEYLDNFFFKKIHYSISNEKNNKDFYYWEKIPRKKYLSLKQTSPGTVKQVKNLYFKKTTLENISDEISNHRTSKKTKIFLIFLILLNLASFFSISLFSSIIIFIIIMLITNIIIAVVYIIKINNYFIFINYSIKGNIKLFHESLNEKLSNVFDSNLFCHIDSIMKNKNLRSFGGSKELYKRSIIKKIKKLPPFINSNIETISIKYNKIQISFFPDFMLIRNESGSKLLPYDSLYIKYIEKPFKEYQFKPGDSQILGHAWFHPNKDKTRDKRFKNNPAIPIMLYSEIFISSAENINIHLQVSNRKYGLTFSIFFQPFVKYYAEERFINEHEQEPQKSKTSYTKEEQEETQYNYNYREWHKGDPCKHNYNKKRNGTFERDNNIVRRSQNFKAFQVLGLKTSANQKEIKKAYLDLVKIYHPDKHAHKNPEIFKAAEEKLKEINDAYDSLLFQ